MQELASSGVIVTIYEFLISSPVLGYFLLALAFIIRGETAMLFSMYLVVQGYMSWGTVALVSFLSLLIGDSLVYGFGRLTENTRFAHWLERRMPFLTKFRAYLIKHLVKIILLVKYTVGLTLITMLSTGWAGVRFKRFFTLHFISVVLWTCIMSGLSYLLLTGVGYLKAVAFLDHIEVGFLIILGAFIFAELLLQYVIKRIAVKDIQEKAGDAWRRAKTYFSKN